MRGYEQFKVQLIRELSSFVIDHVLSQLLYGSFTYVLQTLGQQALELQLERYFTVWAWKWDLEQDSDFGAQLGTTVTDNTPVPIDPPRCRHTSSSSL